MWNPYPGTSVARVKSKTRERASGTQLARAPASLVWASGAQAACRCVEERGEACTRSRILDLQLTPHFSRGRAACGDEAARRASGATPTRRDAAGTQTAQPH